MEKHSDLNSVLIEGKITELHENDFIIQTFQCVEDEDKDTGKIENRFQIMIPYGRKYPLLKGMKVRVVGKLRYQKGDRHTTIISNLVEINKSK